MHCVTYWCLAAAFPCCVKLLVMQLGVCLADLEMCSFSRLDDLNTRLADLETCRTFS